MFWSKKKDDIKLIKSVQKLEISEGDIVVLSCPFSLSMESQEKLREALKGVLLRHGYKVKVIVLEEGVKISNILTKKDIKNINLTVDDNSLGRTIADEALHNEEFHDAIRKNIKKV